MIAQEVECTKTLKDGSRIRIKTIRWIPESKHTYIDYYNEYLKLKESVKKTKDDTELSEMMSEINEEKRIMEAFSECMEMLNI